MQTDLVSALHDRDGLISRLVALRDAWRRSGAPVVVIQQLGFGGEVIPRLAAGSTDLAVGKTSADSFLDTPLEAMLRERGVTGVVVTGLASDYCVDSTARSALSRGFDVTVAADGHSTDARTARPTADEIIAHHNAIFGDIIYPGRRVQVRDCAEIAASARPD